MTVTPAQADTVAVTKAGYTFSQSVLLVEATGTGMGATSRVFQTSTNRLIGTLTNSGGGKYTGHLSWPTNPQNICREVQPGRVVDQGGDVEMTPER